MHIGRNFYKYAAILPAFFVPIWADAATLSVIPAGADITVGSTIVVSVQVDSEGVAINNAEGTLVFPSDIFEAVSVSQSPSIFTLWIQSPANTGGSIAFNGGLPAPGYTGSGGRLFTVILRAKAPGTGTLTLSGAAVRANDGMGTDVLRASGAAVISVAAPAPEAPAAPAAVQEVVQKAAPAGSISLTSTTHPEEDAWYSSAQASLLWKVPAGADAVQTLVGKIKGATPSVIYRPAIAQKTTTTLEDGIWYFNLRAHTAAGWGPVSSYRIQVDTTPPTLGHVKISYKGDDHTLVLSAVAESDPSRGVTLEAAVADAMSGVGKLEVVVDGRVAATIPAEDFLGGTYTLPVTLNTGEHTASLRVVDNAGNQTESEQTTFSVVFEPVWVEKLWTRLSALSISPVWIALVVALILSALSLLMNVVLWRVVRAQSSKLQKKNSGVTRLQKGAKQKLLTLKKDLQKQSKQLDAARSKPDIVPQDAASLDKTRKHLKEAEEYIEQKIKDVS